MIVKRRSIKWYMSLMVLAISFLLLSLQIGATGVEYLESESSELKAKLQDINGEIVDLSLEIEGILQQIEITESDIARTQEALAVCKEEEVDQYEAMKLRIRYMYENGQTSMLEIILGAESIKDLINRSELINAITEYDRNMLQMLIDTREEIEFEEESLKIQKNELLGLEERSKIKQTELELKARATLTDIANVQSRISEIKEAERLEALKEEEAAAGATEDSSGTNNDSTTGSEQGDSQGGSSNLDVFAAILDCESISNYDAMLAVATVIMNRVSSSKFPNSINGVIYQSYQFSPVWTGKLDRVLATGASSLAYRVAQDAINGTRLDRVSHCYYFLTASSTNRNGVSVGGNLFFASW